ALSFLYSVVATAVDQPSAYFNTFTRVWEFGVGTLLALVVPRLARRGVWQAVVTWLGLLAILASALLYTDGSPFPGYIALLPVAGTALVIAAGASGVPGATGRLLGWRPVQFVGDISYSIYLWHWPLIVLLPVALGMRISTPLKLVILVATFLLAWLSKRFIEDPFRIDRPGKPDKPRNPVTRRRVFALALAGMAVVSLAGGTAWAVSGAKASAAQEALDALPDPLGIPCFGASALADGCSPTSVGNAIYPDPVIASSNTGDTGPRICQQDGGSTEVVVCSFGSTDPSAPRYALAGDSHAAQWMPALARLAESEGWQLDTYLRSGCGLSTVDASGLGSAARCAEWNSAALDRIVDGRYDVVLVGMRSSLVGGVEKSPEEIARTVREIQLSWSSVDASGARLVALRDTPQPLAAGIPDMARCVASSGSGGCSMERDDALVVDPTVVAADESGVPVVDLTDRFCGKDLCEAVVGNVLVYRDGSHVSALYIETLAPYLGEAVAQALAS
ncbi:MAG TPA: acyltransferase family protein, partial [Naasia sp.]